MNIFGSLNKEVPNENVINQLLDKTEVKRAKVEAIRGKLAARFANGKKHNKVQTKLDNSISLG